MHTLGIVDFLLAIVRKLHVVLDHLTDELTADRFLLS